MAMSLVLDSLEIKNFRAFKHLRIEKLGRVNLIVGKNNVGKSTLLEALWLYTMKGEPAVLNQILFERDEAPSSNRSDVIRPNGAQRGVDSHRSVLDAESRAMTLNNIFHGRTDTRKPHEPIVVRSSDGDNKAVSVDVIWPFSQPTNNGNSGPIKLVVDLVPQIAIRVGADLEYAFPLERDYQWGIFALQHGIEKRSYAFVGASGLLDAEAGFFWDQIALSDREDDVIAALKVIAPEVQAINLVNSEKASGERVPIVRLKGSSNPIPLRSMGEGMNRMFGIALALVNAKDGMLLIDEVDTGLHYSVLPDLWRLIFEVAHRLNVQVFATTHSKDCLEAFEQAAADNTEEEGVLVRLENRKDGVGAVTFDERELAIVTREQIEVR